MSDEITLTAPGELVVGCNYWASHAGTQMWRQWRPEVVGLEPQTRERRRDCGATALVRR